MHQYFNLKPSTMKAKLFILTALIVLPLSSCRNSKSGKGLKSSQKSPAADEWLLKASAFQSTIDGKETNLYRLRNESGMEVYVTNYGAVIPAILVPDKDGKMGDVVLGFDNVKSYVGVDPSFGTVVGRYGNRIEDGKFELNGKIYEIPINDTRNHNALHGGTKGFSEMIYETEGVSNNSITLHQVSPDGDMGFPGNLSVSVTYTLTDDNSLEVVYRAATDAPTVINLTQHSYFNLNGEGNGTILDHILMINADYYTPVNKRMIPTGEIAPVSGTPMDFRTPTRIGLRIEDDFEQLILANGYDHNWVLNGPAGELKLAATVYCEATGRFLEVSTTEPGVQFYCGNFLDGTLVGKSGLVYKKRGGLCLETQHFPDSPNHPEFPSTVLNPGEEYYQKTIFKFSVK